MASMQEEEEKRIRHLDQCLFCNKIVFHQQLVLSHAASCEAIQRLEKKRTCTHCHWEAPESQSLAHEPICTKKPRYPTMLTCANCGEFDYPRDKINLKELKAHLASGCLPFLKECTEKSLKSCEWNKASDATNNRELRIRREFQSIISSRQRLNGLDCLLCTIAFRDVTNFQRHIYTCDGLLLRQPLRQCRFCKEPFRDLRCYLHEATCRLAPEEDWCRCFNCNKLFRDNNIMKFRSHLTFCLDFCLDFTQEAIDNYHKREEFSNRVLALAASMNKENKNK